MRPTLRSLRRNSDRFVRQTVLFGAAVIMATSMAAADAAAASMSSTGAPSTAQDPIRDGTSDTQTMLREMLLADGPDSSAGAYPRSVRQQLLSFYEKRTFRPAWTGGAAERERATAVLNALERAEDQGLRAQDYASPAQWGDVPTTSKEAAEYDVALTEAVLRYARDVSIGRVRPHQVYEDARLPILHFDAVQVVARMLDSRSMSAALAELPPTHAEYQRLAKALARYRDIAMQGGWPSLPATGALNLESSDSRVGLLIKRLALEDPALAAIANPSSDELRDAVKRFQTRNSLAADGRVTAPTLAALNVPVSNRIEQIRANMERLRWLPRTFEDRYISVNVPDQSLNFVRKGSVELSSRVIVGRKHTPTPILRTSISAIVINPPWEIPGDIVVNQLLPKLRRNPAHLASSNMVLVNGPAEDPQGVKIDWRQVSPSAFPYRVVQNPGPGNALGRVMLDSPNDFDVYLHDTPAKTLFQAADRTLSNGCIRVEGILQLTAIVLGEDNSHRQIMDGINAGPTRRIELMDPVPVYLLYWTAIGTDNGTVEFRPDLYDRDERLIAALAAPQAEDPGDVNAEFGQNTRAPSANLDDASGQTNRITWKKDGSGGIQELLPVQEWMTQVETARAVEHPLRNNSASPNKPARMAQPEPAFPLLKRLFEGGRSQRRNIHR
jgi:murein L,D-transpeptidase YcbB/YkuD